MKSRLLLLVSLVGVGGCSLLGPQQSPEVTTYALSVAKVHASTSHDHKVTLLVSTPTASAGYDTRKIIYTTKPYELSEFTRNQWAATPAEMLEPFLIQKLSDTGHFHAVINSAFSSNRKLLLRTHLIELRQDFTVKPSQVRLAIQADLINAEESRVINSRMFTASVPARANTPYSGVLAANRAVERVLTEVAQFALQSHHPTSVRYRDFPVPPTTVVSRKSPKKVDAGHPQESVTQGCKIPLGAEKQKGEN